MNSEPENKALYSGIVTTVVVTILLYIFQPNVVTDSEMDPIDPVYHLDWNNVMVISMLLGVLVAVCVYLYYTSGYKKVKMSY